MAETKNSIRHHRIQLMRYPMGIHPLPLETYFMNLTTEANIVAAFARMSREDSQKLLAPEYYPSWVAASELIKANVEPVLEQYTPIVLYSLTFSKLTLGTVAPQFTDDLEYLAYQNVNIDRYNDLIVQVGAEKCFVFMLSNARKQSKDMHMRNPGEKPLIAPVETEVVAKPKAKQPKEDPIPAVPPPVVEKEKKQQKYKGRKRYS
ncbi:hypothetical protein Tco_0325170 [Tanacetum coccineum]